MSNLPPYNVLVQAGSAPGLQAKGFGTILCVGHHSYYSSLYRAYQYPYLPAMVTDGFALTDPLYLMAAAISAQSPRPTQIAIGRLPAAYAWGVELSPLSAVVGTVIAFGVLYNGVVYPITRVVPAASTLSAEATAIASLISGIVSLIPTAGTVTGTVDFTSPVNLGAAMNAGSSITIDGNAAAVAQFRATHAVLSGTAGTFTPLITDTLSVVIDGTTYAVTFAGTEATAVACAATIQSFLAGQGSASGASGQVVITSTVQGSAQSVSIGASGNTTRGLAVGSWLAGQVGTNAGPNDVASSTAVTLLEAEQAIRNALVATAVVDSVAGHVRITSATTGSASLVQFSDVPGATFRTALGFDTTAHHGSATSSIMAALAPGTLIEVSALAGAGQPFFIVGQPAASPPIPSAQNISIRNSNGTNGFDTALAAIQNVSDDFYGIAIESASVADIEATSVWCDASATPKVFFALTQDWTEADGTLAHSTIGSWLLGRPKSRTALSYHPAAERIDTGFAGNLLAYSLDRGPIPTGAYRQLAGIDGYALNGTQRANFRANNTNVFVATKGAYFTWEGTFGGGTFIDVTISLDWLSARIGEAVLAYLLTCPNGRASYTVAGIQHVGDAVWSVLEEALRNQLFAPTMDDPSGKQVGYTDPVTGITSKINAQITSPQMQLPTPAQCTVSDRAARILGGNGISFQGRFGGAIHFVNVNGIVLF